MPAHRRPARRTAPARRTPAARESGAHTWWGLQRAAGAGAGHSASTVQRAVLVALGAMVLALIATAGPTVVQNARQAPAPERRISRLAAAPTDEPHIGLVYEGLKPAAQDAPCAGMYELVTPETCSHGPDLAPAGMSVTRDVPPVTAAQEPPADPRRESGAAPGDAAVVADDGGTSLVAGLPALVPDAAPGDAEFVLGPHGVACTGDGRTGKRVQLLYLYEFGQPSRFAEYLGSFRSWAASVDAIFDASAAETRGSRHVRFVTTAQCAVDVAEVQLPAGALATFEASITALRTLGYNRTDRKYLLFADANRYCAIGTVIPDNRRGSGNRNNAGPSYGRVDAGCWGAAMAAHELTHTLGGVLYDSPNSSQAGHCTDDFDLMCWRDSTRTTLKVACPEEVAYRAGWISRDELCAMAGPMVKSGYGKYLLTVLTERVF